MSDVMEWLRERVDCLPDWLRPVVYGASVHWVFLALKGKLVFVPVAVALVMGVSDTLLHGLGLALGLLGLPTLGGAVAGLTYSLVGRHLCEVPLVGCYLAGTVVTAPYLAAAFLFYRMTDHAPLMCAPSFPETAVWVFCSLILGGVVGQWLREVRE